MEDVLPAVQAFWQSIGAARGYVVGSLVTFFGVLINILAVRGLEKARADREEARETTRWTRERSAHLEGVRRDRYAEFLGACDDLAYCNWYAEQVDEERVNEYMEKARTARSTLRLLTDERELIEAVDAFAAAAIEAAQSPGAWSEDIQARLLQGRRDVVTHARAELDRQAIDITSLNTSRM